MSDVDFQPRFGPRAVASASSGAALRGNCRARCTDPGHKEVRLPRSPMAVEWRTVSAVSSPRAERIAR